MREWIARLCGVSGRDQCANELVKAVDRLTAAVLKVGSDSDDKVLVKLAKDLKTSADKLSDAVKRNQPTKGK